MALTYEIADKYLSYDPDTGIITRKIDSGKTKTGDHVGTPTSKGYRIIGLAGHRVIYHRMAWLLYYGDMPKHTIDHINQVKSDNRIANLRDVTNHENHKNMKRQFSNTSGFTGVYWNKPTKNWRVKIEVNGRQIHLGYFKEKLPAIYARIKANSMYGFHPNHGSV